MEAWKAMLANDLKSCEISGIPPQAIEFAAVPDGGSDLDYPVIEPAKMKLALIKEKGTGKVREYVRLSCRIRVEVDKKAIAFAQLHFGHPIWMKWEQAQKEMFN